MSFPMGENLGSSRENWAQQTRAIDQTEQNSKSKTGPMEGDSMSSWDKVAETFY